MIIKNIIKSITALQMTTEHGYDRSYKKIHKCHQQRFTPSKKHNVLWKLKCYTLCISMFAEQVVKVYTHITIIYIQSMYNENRTHYFHKVNENPKDCVVFAIGYINFSKTLI